MSHTPAPWTIANGVSNRVYLINDDKGNAIGETVYADTRNPEDARLIAAAPDMLETLRTIVANASSVQMDPQWAVDMARAAIARATIAN